ncbi:hypothetical protein [Streptomyces sp. KAU_LT]|uniref:hypothetical protein n=1 Tax=Streptomyces sp. KAU_LT TaxID=3046669 RepID=UPI0024B64193|nr:hypothetical protein [Streptomyces sp. KAU_LT]MDI9829684.1 hypothetical protein [Streptomyces sp. KAU_LT]
MALRLNAVQDAAEAVLGCVCAALQDAGAEVDGQPGCPCRSCVVPGIVAWDSCEDPCGQVPADAAGGQLTVSVLRLYSSTDFPAVDRAPATGTRGKLTCQVPASAAVELLITLLRCAPTVDGNACPPSCEELGEAARILHTDMVVVRNALECCLPSSSDHRRGRVVFIGEGRTVGPEGGCVGLEQRVTVALPGCACPTPEGAP